VCNDTAHLVACSFLLKKGHCLKGTRCDFSHNISQSRISKKASVISPKEVIEVSNDVVYPILPLMSVVLVLILVLLMKCMLYQ
jgi:hypothetical protein